MSTKIAGEVKTSYFLYSRFQPKDSFDGDKGIRCHNFFTALFVKLFGSGIDKITTTDNKTIYLNKGDLDKWKIEARKRVTECNVNVDDTAAFIASILSAIKQKNPREISSFYKQAIEEEKKEKQNLIDGFKKLTIPTEGLSGSYKTESCTPRLCTFIGP